MATRTEDPAMHRHLATAFALTALTVAAGAAAATPEELEARMNVLAAQVIALQSEVAELKAQKAATAPAASAPVAMAAAAPWPPESQVQWFGYGELNYSRPTGDAAAATADVARFVLG